MNVLSVIHYPIFGGPHNQAVLVGRTLAARGIRMVVLLPTGASAERRIRDEGVEVMTIPLHRVRATVKVLPHLRLLGTLLPEVAAIRKIIRERSIDVVQVAGLVNPHGAVAGRLEGAGVVWQLIDTRAPTVVRRLMMPLVTRLADVVMPTGRAVASAHPGAERMGDRLVVFYPPVDPDQFRPAEWDREEARAEFGLSAQDRVVGTVGNLNPQKGHEYLIEACALARAERPDAKLLIVGASHETHRAYEARLVRKARELGLVVGRDVVFAGGLADVRRGLAAMDVFALASVPRSEGAPTAVEEAMMMGLPVVSANVGAVNEVVVDGETGYVVPPLAPRVMAHALLRILSDRALQKKMGERGRERCIRMFAATECARMHEHAYTRACDHRRREAR